MVGTHSRSGQHFVEFRLHLRKTVPTETQGSEIGLKIESCDLGGQPGIFGMSEDFTGNGRGPEIFIDEKHLLLRTDATHTAFNEIVVEHVVKRTQIVEQRFHKQLFFLLVELLLNVMLTHKLNRFGLLTSKPLTRFVYSN